jgi:hypothetical protein
MPRMLWPLRHGRPCVEIVLALTQGGHPFPRVLLADTGAGSQTDSFELVLDEGECLVCGAFAYVSVPLGGSYAGVFPVYVLPVQVPALGFAQTVRAVGVQSVPAGFDGIACFRFLNRFTYGNFGDPGRFGLEC